MELWGVSDVGAVRKQNQDAYYVSPADARYPFAVVCDGMGGARAGNVASSMAVESFAATVGEGLNGEKPDVESLLRRAVEQANELVCYRAAMDESCRGMGTTLVAAVVGPERVYLVRGPLTSSKESDHPCLGRGGAGGGGQLRHPAAGGNADPAVL